MNVLLRHTEYLLATNDCVVVPGLGAFLASRREAEFDCKSNRWHHYERKFSFNEALTVSDGLLVMSVARSNDNNYEHAAAIVEKCVNDIKAELSRTGEFGFGRIGRLEMSLTGELNFRPYKKDRITPLADWLPDFYFKNSSTSIQESAYTDEKKKKVIPIRFNRFIRTAVGAAAAILIAILVSTPISMQNINSASTVPPVKISQSQSKIDTTNRRVSPRQNMPVKSGKNNGEKINNSSQGMKTVPLKDTQPAKASTTQSPVRNQRIDNSKNEQRSDQKQVTPSSGNKKIEKKAAPAKAEKNVTPVTTYAPIRFDEYDTFILVVASLPSFEKAQQYVTDNSQKGRIHLEILDCGDKFRVYAATGADAKQAYSQLQNPTLSKKFADAWVARR